MQFQPLSINTGFRTTSQPFLNCNASQVFFKTNHRTKKVVPQLWRNGGKISQPTKIHSGFSCLRSSTCAKIPPKQSYGRLCHEKESYFPSLGLFFVVSFIDPELVAVVRNLRFCSSTSFVKESTTRSRRSILVSLELWRLSIRSSSTLFFFRNVFALSAFLLRRTSFFCSSVRSIQRILLGWDDIVQVW